jgi:glucokinase
MRLLLAADVGGTKTLLALFADDGRGYTPLHSASLESARYTGFAEAIEDFLGSTGADPDCASFGVAGPVIEQRALLTNLGWTVDAQELATQFGFRRVTLLNDLVATASALPVMTRGDLITLQEGAIESGGTMAIIAPGTGLGQAFLSWDGDRYVPHPSEGGHGDFAPRSPLQVALLRHLEQRFDHVSYERVCSGRGIANIYDFLRLTGAAAEPAWLAGEIARVVDPTPTIVRAGMEVDPPIELARLALRTFVSILAAEAANLALTVLSTGGMYLGGGLPPRVLPLLREPSFLSDFRGKGRMSEIMERIPLHVVMRSDAALLGAAAHGLETMQRG